MSPGRDERRAHTVSASKEFIARMSVMCLIAAIVGIFLDRAPERLQGPGEQWKNGELDTTMVRMPPGMAFMMRPNMPSQSMATSYAFAQHANDEVSKAMVCKQLGLYVGWDKVFARLADLQPAKRAEIMRQIAYTHALPPNLTPEQIRKSVCDGNRFHLTQSTAPSTFFSQR